MCTMNLIAWPERTLAGMSAIALNGRVYLVPSQGKEFQHLEGSFDWGEGCRD